MRGIPEIAVTDTHALIWWITNQRRLLGQSAAAFFGQVDAGAAVVCVPTVVLVELDEAIYYGDVSLDEPFPDFVERLILTPSRYQVVELTSEIVMRSHELIGIPERGDRLIAATAAAIGYPLVTRDPVIVSAIAGDHTRLGRSVLVCHPELAKDLLASGAKPTRNAG